MVAGDVVDRRDFDRAADERHGGADVRAARVDQIARHGDQVGRNCPEPVQQLRRTFAKFRVVQIGDLSNDESVKRFRKRLGGDGVVRDGDRRIGDVQPCEQRGQSNQRRRQEDAPFAPYHSVSRRNSPPSRSFQVMTPPSSTA